MIRDLEQEQPSRDEQADVCVVGAGAAGIVVAVELARLGKTVLLLEGGGAGIEECSQEPYQSAVVGHMHRGVHTGRVRVHGGTTTRWGGQILELDEIDFERREWIDGSGWPIRKSDLARHYARALDLEGLGGAIREDEQVWRVLGLKTPSYGELTPYFSRWCPEPNFAVLHRKALEGEEITVWLHANAVGLDLEGETVKAVRARTLGGVEESFRAREFVFCMGAIESSRFFLQAKEGVAPWNVSGLLGRHFQDHIDSNAATVRVIDRRRFHEVFDNVLLDRSKYHPKLKLSAESQREWETLNAGAMMYFVTAMDDRLAGMKTTAKKILRGKIRDLSVGEIAGLAKDMPLLARQAWRYKTAHRVYNPPDAQVQLRVHCEQEPLGGSSISVCEERDSLGLLRTRLDWRISDREQETIRRFALMAKEQLAGMAAIDVEEDLLNGAASYRQGCDDSNHHMGGMRMAATASQGVVDPQLRLFGTVNCYVCSGAVFPTSGFSNPTHTVLALAVRLAEHLTQK